MGLHPFVKQQGHEADHICPSSTNIKIHGGIPLFPIHLHGKKEAILVTGRGGP
jgi:hypothetical protein